MDVIIAAVMWCRMVVSDELISGRWDGAVFITISPPPSGGCGACVCVYAWVEMEPIFTDYDDTTAFELAPTAATAAAAPLITF